MPKSVNGFSGGLHIRGLRQRWLVNAVLPVFALVTLAVIIYVLSSAQCCYGNMRTGLEARARAAADAPNAWAATEADGPSVAHFPSGENHAHSVRPACGPGGTRSVPCASGTASGCRCRKASRASDVG